MLCQENLPTCRYRCYKYIQDSFCRLCPAVCRQCYCQNYLHFAIVCKNCSYQQINGHIRNIIIPISYEFLRIVSQVDSCMANKTLAFVGQPYQGYIRKNGSATFNPRPCIPVSVFQRFSTIINRQFISRSTYSRISVP